MIIRLHNLSAHPPQMGDSGDVEELLRTCSSVEVGSIDFTKEEIQKRWKEATFELHADAWVIVTKQGHLVGYADVRWEEDEHLAGCVAFVRVHPDYQGRGIEMLLVRLAEVRARQRMVELPMGQQITLRVVLHEQDRWMREVVVPEGYHLGWHFWRVVIALEEGVAASDDPFAARGQVAVDLVIETDNLLGSSQIRPRTGMYTAQQYSVYVKELRAPQEGEMGVVQVVPCVLLR